MTKIHKKGCGIWRSEIHGYCECRSFTRCNRFVDDVKVEKSWQKVTCKNCLKLKVVGAK